MEIGRRPATRRGLPPRDSRRDGEGRLREHALQAGIQRNQSGPPGRSLSSCRKWSRTCGTERFTYRASTPETVSAARAGLTDARAARGEPGPWVGASPQPHQSSIAFVPTTRHGIETHTAHRIHWGGRTDPRGDGRRQELDAPGDPLQDCQRLRATKPPPHVVFEALIIQALLAVRRGPGGPSQAKRAGREGPRAVPTNTSRPPVGKGLGRARAPRGAGPPAGPDGARSKTIADGPDRVLENTRGQPRRRPPPYGPPGEE